MLIDNGKYIKHVKRCYQFSSLQMNQKIQSMRGNVNNLIGTQLCVGDGVTSVQINVSYATSPFLTTGSRVCLY